MSLEFLWDKTAGVAILGLTDDPSFLSGAGRPKGYRFQARTSDGKIHTIGVLPMETRMDMLIAVVPVPGNAASLDAKPIYGSERRGRLQDGEKDSRVCHLADGPPPADHLDNVTWRIIPYSESAELELDVFNNATEEFIAGSSGEGANEEDRPHAVSVRKGRYLYPTSARTKTAVQSPLQIQIGIAKYTFPEGHYWEWSGREYAINEIVEWKIYISIHDNDPPADKDIELNCEHFIAGTDVVELLADKQKDDVPHKNIQYDKLLRDTRGPVEFTLPFDHKTGFPVGFLDRIVIEANPHCGFELFQDGRASRAHDGLAVIVARGTDSFRIDNGAFRDAILQQQARQDSGETQYQWINKVEPYGDFFISGGADALNVTAYAYCRFFAALHREDPDIAQQLPIDFAEYLKYPAHFQLLVHPEFCDAAHNLHFQLGGTNASDWLIGLCRERFAVDLDVPIAVADTWFAQFEADPWRLVEISLFPETLLKACRLGISFGHKQVGRVIKEMHQAKTSLDSFEVGRGILIRWGLTDTEQYRLRTVAEVITDDKACTDLVESFKHILAAVMDTIGFVAVEASLGQGFDWAASFEDALEDIVTAENRNGRRLCQLAGAYEAWVAPIILTKHNDALVEFCRELDDVTTAEKLVERIAGALSTRMDEECRRIEQLANACGYRIDVKTLSGRVRMLDATVSDVFWRLTAVDGQGKAVDEISELKWRNLEQPSRWGFTDRIRSALRGAVIANTTAQTTN